MSNKTLCCLPEGNEEILEGGEVREREEHLEDVAVELLPAPRELDQEGLYVEPRDPPLQLALDQPLDGLGVLGRGAARGRGLARAAPLRRAAPEGAEAGHVAPVAPNGRIRPVPLEVLATLAPSVKLCRLPEQRPARNELSR